MYFSKNIAFFSLFLCVGSTLAMDSALVEPPKKILLYSFLESKDYEGLHSLLSNMNENGKSSMSENGKSSVVVVDVNEKNIFQNPFAFKLLDTLLMEDKQILKKSCSLKESAESIKNANLLSKCLQLVIGHKSFDCNATGSIEKHLFCSLLEVIDMNYNNKLRYKERGALFGEEYGYFDKEKYVTLNKFNPVKNLYACISLLMKKQSFDPNTIIDQEKKQSFLHYWLDRMNVLHNYENDAKLVEPEDELFILKGLLSHGANTNQVDGNGCFPLHYIAKRGCDIYQNIFATERSLKIAEMLLQRGANVNCVDLEGKTPLHFCPDDTTMVPLLLMYGAHFKEDMEILNPYVDLMLLNLKSIAQSVENANKEKLAGLCQGKSIVNFVMGRQISGPLNIPKVECPFTPVIMTFAKGKNFSYETTSAILDYMAQQESFDSEPEDFFG